MDYTYVGIVLIEEVAASEGKCVRPRAIPGAGGALSINRAGLDVNRPAILLQNVTPYYVTLLIKDIDTGSAAQPPERGVFETPGVATKTLAPADPTKQVPNTSWTLPLTTGISGGVLGPDRIRRWGKLQSGDPEIHIDIIHVTPPGQICVREDKPDLVYFPPEVIVEC